MSDIQDFTDVQSLHILLNEVERLSKFTIQTKVRNQIIELFCGESDAPVTSETNSSDDVQSQSVVSDSNNNSTSLQSEANP